MPFVSKEQNAWAHTPAGTKALGGEAKVKEWESATDYSHLPKHVHVKRAHSGGYIVKHPETGHEHVVKDIHALKSHLAKHLS